MKQIILVLVISCSISCKNSTTEPEQQSLPDFPASVGSLWTYSVYDSVSQSSDTLTVKIVSNVSTSPIEIMQLWEFKLSNSVDTEVVTLRADTVLFQRKDRTHNFNVSCHTNKFVFPLQVGQIWDVSEDSTYILRVDENASISVPAGLFSNAFRIREESSSLDNGITINTWFVPKIGVVSVHRRSAGFVTGFYEIVWQLESYDIAL